MNDPAMLLREYESTARLEERRHNVAATLWETPADLQRFRDAFVEMVGPLEAPDAPYPFKVTRRNRVYVADPIRR